MATRRNPLENGVQIQNPDSSGAARVQEQLLLRLESHRQSCLAKLNEATRLILEVAAFTHRDPLSILAGPAMYVDSQNRRLTPIRVVREAARSFGDDQFTLDDLCRRVREKFPSVQLDREVVSRRLYDLRQGQNPVVACASDVTEPRERRTRAMSPAFYRFRPPKLPGLPLKRTVSAA